MKPSTLFEETLLRLRNQVADGAPGGYLPPVRVLAARLGVSVVTLTKALAILERDGLVRRFHGKGVRILPARGRRDKSPRPGQSTRIETKDIVPRWAAIRDLLLRDFVNGRFRSGTGLPPLKELSAVYGASRPTIRKALRDLADNRFIEPHGRTYRGTEPPQRRHAAAFAILTEGNPVNRRFKPIASWVLPLLQQVEARCERANLRSHTVVCLQNEGGVEFLTPDGRDASDWMCDSGAVIGVCAIMGYGMDPGVLMRALARLSRPVAYFDTTCSTTNRKVLSTYAGVRVVSPPSSAYGTRQVAHHLLANGHGRVAYISPIHSFEWSRIRYRGLVRAFAALGFADSVQLFAFADYDPSWEYFDKGDWETRGETMRRKLVDFAAREDPVYGGFLSEHLGGWRTPFTQTSVRKHALPLFEEALDHKEITAWVCANDQIAIMALRFLCDRGVAVPGDLSVVGFDNTVESVGWGLTTLDMNMAAVSRAVLDHALDPRISRRLRHLEVEGFVVRRHTVAHRALG